ncbi:MAG: hypothetical protein ABIP51_05890 [Bacteroidia bacterium]
MRPLILLVILILTACHGGNNNANTVDTVTTENIYIDTIADLRSDESTGSAELFWKIEFENKTKKKNPHFTNYHLNIDSLIKGLNEKFPDIKIEKVKLGHDTLYTEIKDSHYLSENMGTSGASFYIAEAVLNLTSLKGVNFVKIDFEEGSHASPDIWNKKDFDDYKEVK